MQTTGIFQAHQYDVTDATMGEPSWLMPFGDIHYGCPAHSDRSFSKYIECAKEKEHAVFLGMGDYFDIASTSERGILSSGILHDSTLDTMDTYYKELADEFINKICFMKGRIAGLIEGNHYAVLRSGITTTQYMAEVLGCKYLGVAGFVRLKFTLQETSRTSIDIFAHHGKGASRLIGGSLNRVQQLAEVANADIYLMGHDHKRSMGVQSKMYLDRNGTVKEQRQLFARTGSFLRAYQSGKVSYIADMAGAAADLGAISISMTPRRDKSINGRGLWVDLAASI